MENMTIGFAADHAGFELKEKLVGYLLEKGFSVKDFGTYSKERCDYPDFAHPLASAVVKGECKYGITICYTGNGINVTVNKHRGIRGTICMCEEMARLARNHNDANICALASKYTGIEEARTIVDTFLSSGFDGGRHEQRIRKIEEF